MPSLSDEAIIIKAVPCGESDLILHLQTAENGKRAAIAKGAKRSRKRFSGALQPFTRIRIVLDTRRTRKLDRLEDAEAVDSFPEIREDLSKICLASYFVELCDCLILEGQPLPEVYQLLRFFLERLKRAAASPKHLIFFELRLLDLLGHGPDFRHDSDSGRPLQGAALFDPARLTFHPASGEGFAGRFVSVGEETRLAMESASRVPFAELSKVRMNAGMIAEALGITRAFLASILPRQPKSRAMVDAELFS